MACTNCGGSGHNAATCTRTRRERSDKGQSRGSYKENWITQGLIAGYSEGVDNAIAEHEKKHKVIGIINNVISAVVGFGLSWFYFDNSVWQDLLVSLITMLITKFALDVYFQAQIHWWTPTIVFIITLITTIIPFIIYFNMSLVDSAIVGVIVASVIKYLFVTIRGFLI